MATRVEVAEKARTKARELLTSRQPDGLEAETEVEMERILRKHLGPDFALVG